MSDRDLRELERAVAADQTDLDALGRLQDARVRSGLGWHGERGDGGVLAYQKDGPGFLVPLTERWGRHERGVYLWGAGVDPHFVDSNDPPPACFLEMIYVPGGEVACQCWRTQRWSATFDPSSSCNMCHGTWRRQLAPFYLGRYPVVNAEWLSYLVATEADRRRCQNEPRYHDATANEDAHPVVNVSLHDSKAFCKWAGLRLPTDSEWRWAALGKPEERPCDHGNEAGVPFCANCGRNRRLGSHHASCITAVWVCSSCCNTGGKVMKSRSFPWGDTEPTDDLCVSLPGSWINSSEPLRQWQSARTRPVVMLEAEQCVHPEPGSSILLSRVEERLVPARPLGKSWCGANDLCGNVEEWVDLEPRGFDHLGGSFRSYPRAETWPRNVDHAGLITGGEASDEIGFRITLSVT